MTIEVIRNPINHVLEMVTKKTPKSTEPKDLATIETEIEKVREASRGLLPIERSSSRRLAQIEKDLLRQRSMAQSGLKYAEYPEFPMEALTWRDKRGYPRLAVFSLNSANFEIGIIVGREWGRMSYRKTHVPELPRPVLRMYDDVFLSLRDMAKEKRKSMRLRATFQGLIPLDVKEQITETQSHFKKTYIVAEASRWDLKESAPIRRVDPLLVGWDGYRLWLLASFDTTSVEKYIEKMALSKIN